MHCTWFNEKKKGKFPLYFLWVVSSPNTTPHLLPSSSLACPSQHHLGKERYPHPTPSSGGTSPGTLGPGPAGLQLLTSPGACAPQTHSTRPQPDCLRLTEEAHAAGQGPSFASS